MATIQMVSIETAGAGVFQLDQEQPICMTWGQLHESQQQDGAAGYVYRWLMGEYCRCEFRQRNGEEWTSPRREIDDIVSDMLGRDAQSEAARIESEHEAQRAAMIEAERREHDAELARVANERNAIEPNDPWWPIPHWEVPTRVRFDTPGHLQGQIVEVSYGTFGRDEACTLDPYKNVLDHSDRSSRTYRRRDV